jgi:Ulp1 family protease
MFINIKEKTIIYFDSNGNKPPKEVKKLIDKIISQGKQLGFDFNVFINKISHQKSNSECGMYSLYFIIQMLKDTDKDYFLKQRIPDEDVFKLRDKYFNGK